MILPWFSTHFEQLTGRFLAGRLHHGLLLSGPDGIGKQMLARELAAVLLCKQPDSRGACGQCQSCQLLRAGTHADFHILESEKQLGVDAIREGISRLSGTAQIGRNKVLLLCAADTMTESASNALLKTLEEPTGNTFLILLTSRIARLLPTILSRCEKHALAPPNVAESLAWLDSEGIDADEALLNAYGNAPLRVKTALEEAPAVTYRDFTDGFAALMQGSKSALSLATSWQEDALQIVTWCEQLAYKQYCQQQKSSDLACYDACKSAVQALNNPGVNKVLILTSVLDAFVRH
ncbi:DNA polymerase III subunit delta' [Alteromonas sp. CYL-A6]|uniref:DNA polymerase III subunit delta' n=1 Tax=Alteromonas nitratireducens TaxID=3390813 RepID=UPI0034BADC64